MRTKTAQVKSETSALVSKRSTLSTRRNFVATTLSRPFCNYCKKPGNIESGCYAKYLQLISRNKKSAELKPAFIVNQEADDQVISVMAKYENLPNLRIQQNGSIDSGCCNHMTYDKNIFLAYAWQLHFNGNG